jgi:hypothetical protein
MAGPYINNGNYRYGVSQYTQPNLPCYDSIGHHKKPNYRQPASDTYRDDGVPYTSYLEDNTNACATCGRCNRNARANMISSLVRLETTIDKYLKVKMYGSTSDKNKTVLMKEGNKYCVSYLTETGIATVTGTYRGVSSNVPEECTSYIGNYSSTAASSYICLDCSTEGASKKILIYIAGIRYIEAVYEEGDDAYFNLTQAEKIKSMVSQISSAISVINTYIKVNNNGKGITDDATTNSSGTQCCCNGSVLIMHSQDDCCNTSDGTSNSNDDADYSEYLNDDGSLDFNSLISAMKDVKSIMNSFITAYDIDTTLCGYDDDCSCNTVADVTKDTVIQILKEAGVPIVEEVPYNATEQGLYMVEQESGENDGWLDDIET